MNLNIEYTTTRKYDYHNKKSYDYHNKKSIEYLNIECAFDIETSSTYINNEKFAFMYLWGFGLGPNGEVLYLSLIHI